MGGQQFVNKSRLIRAVQRLSTWVVTKYLPKTFVPSPSMAGLILKGAYTLLNS